MLGDAVEESLDVHAAKARKHITTARAFFNPDNATDRCIHTVFANYLRFAEKRSEGTEAYKAYSEEMARLMDVKFSTFKRQRDAVMNSAIIVTVKEVKTYEVEFKT